MCRDSYFFPSPLDVCHLIEFFVGWNRRGSKRRRQFFLFYFILLF